MKITYIGHATTLIELNGNHFLTDPHFGRRHLVFKRVIPLSYDPAHLPELTACLVSHAHYDHLDIGSYKYIPSSVPIIVPEGIGKLLSSFLNNPIIELTTWATQRLGEAEVIAVPVAHVGGRLLKLRFRKTVGFVLKARGQTVYFAGDSSYGPHFKQVGQMFSIDAALLPIGAYFPRWLTRKKHMDPSEALQAFEDLRAKHLIPIHWGTFRQTLEPADGALLWLKRLLGGLPSLQNSVHILRPGESFEAGVKS